jgi:hypothetical protein
MSRLHFALMSLVLGLTAQPLFATTYYVAPPLANPCTSAKGGFEVFPSIQYAVTHVPEGSTINICPGTYYEQVTISQPLTLQGISGNNNSSQVIIAMPPDGLTTTSSLKFGTIAAQVEVTKGPVNITGVTVDGTASSSNCPNGFYVGIFYSGDTNADASGASGVVNGSRHAIRVAAAPTGVWESWLNTENRGTAKSPSRLKTATSTTKQIRVFSPMGLVLLSQSRTTTWQAQRPTPRRQGLWCWAPPAACRTTTLIPFKLACTSMLKSMSPTTRWAIHP